MRHAGPRVDQGMGTEALEGGVHARLPSALQARLVTCRHHTPAALPAYVQGRGGEAPNLKGTEA